MPETELELQLLCGFPGVLQEPLKHVATVGGVAANAEFGIGRVQAQRNIRDGEAGSVHAGIVEHETPVLVVGPSWNTVDVDLIEVVLSCAFKVAAEFDRVVSLDQREVVVDLPDRSR